MIKKKDMDNSVGLMEELIKDNGKMANKMGKELIKIKKEYKEVEFG